MRRLLVISVVIASCGSDMRAPESPCQPASARVVEVIDGDTVELDTGQRVRYLLVDTPELSTAECFSEEATQLNEALVLNRVVTLEYDIENLGHCTDMFSRLLAYVYVGDRMVNRVLLERGHARVLVVVPPDRSTPYRFEDEFRGVEAEAQDSNAGQWGLCP